VRYLITSALPYINGIKHLGNLIGSMLPADVYARYLRKEKYEVLYICGTDEHGTPAEIASIEEGINVSDYCDKMHKLQLLNYNKLGLSFDYFGKTSSDTHALLVQQLFGYLKANGYVAERTIKQFYSNVDKRFLPDRYVMGICPFCGYEKTKGDQCDSCDKLIDPIDLINPYSSISGSRDIELKETFHLFLELPLLQEKVSKWIDSHNEWNHVTKGIAKKWLQEGLKSRCISRDLQWGVKVPDSKFENKVFYVWFDAPIGYISMTKEYGETINQVDLWQKWWLNFNQDVYYTQFMAKDNVPFHAIFFPAMIFGMNQGIKQVDDIKAFNWLKFEDKKFSTSNKHGIFIDQALEIYPADYWRYYLLSIAPESDDSNFTIDGFASTINKDLADVFGNFISRVFAMTKKYNDYIENYLVNKPNICIDNNLKLELEKLVIELNDYYLTKQYRKMIHLLRNIWSFGNEYIAKKAPWVLIKNNINEAIGVLIDCLYLVKVFCIISEPVIPNIVANIISLLKTNDDLNNYKISDVISACNGYIQINCESNFNLINKISDDEIAYLKNNFVNKS
jgi:methionyl-tRNA synthetase